MILGDLNMLFFFFTLIFFTLFININSALNLLLIAELLWITLYVIALIIGFTYNNLNVLSLTFFFLVFSAIELGIGLILLLFQNILNRSLNLNDNDTNLTKHNFKLNTKIYLNKIYWKI